MNQLIAEVDEAREQELLNLLSGGHVTTAADEYIAYEDIDWCKDNLYAALLLTGYLKCTNKIKEDELTLYELAIPNKEIYSILRQKISPTLRC